MSARECSGVCYVLFLVRYVCAKALAYEAEGLQRLLSAHLEILMGSDVVEGSQTPCIAILFIALFLISNPNVYLKHRKR